MNTTTYEYLSLLTLLSLIFFKLGCGADEESFEKPSSLLALKTVQDEIRKNESVETTAIDFASALAPTEYNYLFDKTPTGSYINLATSWSKDRNLKIEQIVKGEIEWIGKHRKCTDDCTPEFKSDYNFQKTNLAARLIKVTQNVIENEVRNTDGYGVLYHGYPMTFRLYQDVIREIASYELLNRLETTYMFRQFAYNDPINNLPEFLKNWWQKFIEYAQEKGTEPKPLKGETPQPDASSVGLRYYPDSIRYAQNYVLSANLSLFGNNLSMLNNTLFYFLNNRSATGLNIADQLIKASLGPYVIDSNGKPDEARLTKVVADLRNVFNQYMGNSGGQLAQIFIKKTSLPALTFLCWNGGEPIWFSQKTKKAIFDTDNGSPVFRPTNVFWPNEKQSDYYLPNPELYFSWYQEQPYKLGEVIPILGKRYQRVNFGYAREFLELMGQDLTQKLVENFAIMDISQARFMPQTKSFANEDLVGVKMYTSGEVSQENLDKYNANLKQIIETVFRDFLNNVKEVQQFKPGTFPLKELFQKASGKT